MELVPTRLYPIATAVVCLVYHRVYSNYTKSNFGVVLHHNFDKLGLLGGRSDVKFGAGFLTKPIRVLINGRASTRFGDVDIPVREMLEKTSRDFLVGKFPSIDREKDIETHYNLSTASSPGKVDEKAKSEGTRKYWFEPRGVEDLKELKHLVSNDTSMGCGYAPLGRTEKIVLSLERTLNSSDFKKDKPWMGSDMKIMAVRNGNKMGLTMCVPQIANHVPDVESYKRNLDVVKEFVKKFVSAADSNIELSLYMNTRDDFSTNELYLTAIGSSIESGDEGLVGRGNRINGLISPCKPMAMEGACGKNPVYHVGKLYNIAANRMAERMNMLTGGASEVYMISQSGRTLQAPWKTIVFVENNDVDETVMLSAIKDELSKIPQITDELLQGKVGLF
jgi:S-adenosylmethionine synthetase